MLTVKDEWPRLRALCWRSNSAAMTYRDAWIAACVVQTREALATFDQDFLRLLEPNTFELLAPRAMTSVFNFTFVPWFRSVAPYIHKLPQPDLCGRALPARPSPPASCSTWRRTWP